MSGRASRAWSESAARVQATAEDVTYGGDELGGGVAAGGGTEHLADVQVTVKSLLRRDQPLGPDDFVFNGFGAEAADPLAHVSLSYPLYVRRRTLLC